jgi:hypothetical protein
VCPETQRPEDCLKGRNPTTLDRVPEKRCDLARKAVVVHKFAYSFRTLSHRALRRQKVPSATRSKVVESKRKLGVCDLFWWQPATRKNQGHPVFGKLPARIERSLHGPISQPAAGRQVEVGDDRLFRAFPRTGRHDEDALSMHRLRIVQRPPSRISIRDPAGEPRFGRASRLSSQTKHRQPARRQKECRDANSSSGAAPRRCATAIHRM